ncbi:MAG: AMP-binding protein [Paraburkholderia sp.]|uniref:AMP-binding protein n=1 Tax=Paraburkholderia sp. TaxID=1926495 RepID=UPI003C5A255D
MSPAQYDPPDQASERAARLIALARLNLADVDRFDLSSIAYLSGGGAAMPQAVAQQIEARCGIPYVEGYGLTETMATTHINPPKHSKQQCMGVPVFNTGGIDMLSADVGDLLCRVPRVIPPASSTRWNKACRGSRCVRGAECKLSGSCARSFRATCGCGHNALTGASAVEG